MNVTAQAGDTLIPVSGAAPLDSASSIQALKVRLRTALRERRKAIGHAAAKQAERAVARGWCACAPLRRARRIGLYLAMGSEMRTAALIVALQRRGIGIYAPALVRGQLRFRALRGQRLSRHALGMAEPRCGRSLRAAALDVLVLPLLGFDARGTRLGQGGGYYDRALVHCGWRPYRLGLGYAAQGVPALPREPWDQPLRAVLTERGLRRFSRSFSGSS